MFVDKGVTAGEHQLADLPRAQRRLWRLRALDQEALAAALKRLGHPVVASTPAGVDIELGSDSDAAGTADRRTRVR